MNKEQFNQLCENIITSHSLFNYATETPFYVVQERQTDYFKNQDSFDYKVWVDSENESVYRNYDPELFDELSVNDRKEINDKAFSQYNELFDRIDEKHQRELLREQLQYLEDSGNASVRYCSDYWVDVSWHLTHQSAEKFLENRPVDKFKIYTYSSNTSYELQELIKLLKEKRLTLIEEQYESKEQ